MPDFNPKVPSETPDFINRSRGATPIESTKSTFAGVTDTLSPLVKGASDLFSATVDAGDKFIKKTIEDEAYNKVDAVREEFGVEAATNLQEDVTVKQLPNVIARSGEELDLLDRQHRSGKLKTSHYTARLNSISRQLRQKYPAYRTEVDQMISKITGMNPANELVDQLRRESAVTEKPDPLRQFIISNKSYINEGEASAILSGALSLDQATIRVAGKASAEKQNELRVAQFNASLTEGKVDDRMFEETATRDVFQTISIAFTDKDSPVAKNVSSMQEAVTNLQASLNNGVPDAAQKTALIGQMQQLQGRITAMANEKIVGYQSKGMKASIADSLRTSVKGIFDSMTENITNGNYGALKADAAFIDALQTSDKANVLMIPELRKAAAISSTLGPQTLNTYLSSSNGKNLAGFELALRKAELQGVWANGTSVKALTERGKTSGVNNPDYFRTVLDDVIKSSLNQEKDSLPMAVQAKAMESLYGPNNQGFLASVKGNGGNISDLEAKRRVYNLMTSTQQAETAQKLGGETWENYKQWVLDSGINLNRTVFNDLNNQVIDRREFEIKMDPKSLQLEAIPVPGANVDTITRERMKVIEPVNSVLRSISQVYSLDKDPEKAREVFQRMFSQYIDLNRQGDPRGAVEKASDYIGGVISNALKGDPKIRAEAEQNLERIGNSISDFARGDPSSVVRTDITKPNYRLPNLSGGSSANDVKGGSGEDALLPLERGSVLPLTTDPNTGQTYFDLESGLTGPLVSGLKYFKEVYEKGYDPSDPEQVKKLAGSAFDIASTIGGAGMLTPKPKNAVGMFGGKLGASRMEELGFSGITKKALDSADVLEKEGFKPDDIARELNKFIKEGSKEFSELGGFSKGADGNWRFEISDHNFKLKNEVTEEIFNPEKLSVAKAVGLQQVLKDSSYNTLIKIYPELKGLKIELEMGPTDGYFIPSTKEIKITAPTKEQMESVLIHEVQHAVQIIEGFARGGAPFKKSPASEEIRRSREFVKDSVDDLNAKISDLYTEMQNLPLKNLSGPEYKRELQGIREEIRTKEGTKKVLERVQEGGESPSVESYRRIAGEVEARNADTRSNFTPEQRRETPPEKTEDVRRRKQTVVK